MTNVRVRHDKLDANARMAVRRALDALNRGAVAEARRTSDALLDAHPEDAEVLFLASEVRLAEDDPEGAFGFIDAANRAAPGQVPLLLKKAENLIMLRRRGEVKQVAAEILALAANDGRTLWELGRLCNRCDDPAAAKPLLERAINLVGAQPSLMYELAVARFHTGDSDGAESMIDALLQRAPHFPHALYLRATLRRQNAERNHVADLRRRLDAGFPNPEARAVCLFALAKELEDLAQYEDSFAALSEGAALKRKAITGYDAAAERDSIDAVRAAYTAAVIDDGKPGCDERGAIFIVGMPRTGTTLLERMLSRHREVGSAGELLDFGQVLAMAARRAQRPGMSLVEASLQIDFAALGRNYMIGAWQAARGGRGMFIDKMPINFIYCGLIRKALPNAKIVHLARNPMDTCYAVYKTLFSQAYFFSYDLDELADYYLCYRRMMQHWHEVMPDGILDVRYEDLVSDPEPQVRRILEWCGLDWQPQVLDPAANELPSTTASSAQVRQPIHTGSIGMWRHYESDLAPLQARLQAAGLTDVC